MALQKSKITVLLPDSILDNEDTLLLKTKKIGILARTTTMFRIGLVYFYKENGLDKDRNILGDICTHLSFPPYLRKYAPHSPNLRYTAILPPIHSPNHSGVEHETITYSEGIIVANLGKKITVDLGRKNPITVLYKGQHKKGETVTIQSTSKTMSVQDKIPESIFWKTQFEIGDLTLDQYLQSNPQSYVIASSKSGNPISTDTLLEIQHKPHSRLLLAFGPIRGSFRDHVKNKKSINMWINIIPNQGTKTVKIEEAVHSALTLMNLCSLNLK